MQAGIQTQECLILRCQSCMTGPQGKLHGHLSLDNECRGQFLCPFPQCLLPDSSLMALGNEPWMHLLRTESCGREGTIRQTLPCCPGPFLMNADVTAQTAEAPGSGSSSHKTNVLPCAEGISGHTLLSRPLPQRKGCAVGC